MATRTGKRKQPPDPHIWRAEVTRFYHANGEAGELARTETDADLQEGRLVLRLPVNPHFGRPHEINEDRGVELDTHEHIIAQEAIALRVVGELVALDTLQGWTRREIARRYRPPRPGRKTPERNGSVQLAKDLLSAGVLVGLPIPTGVNAKGKELAKLAQAAMLRAVERWSTSAAESHKTFAGPNARRVAALRGVFRGREGAAQAVLQHGRQIVTDGIFLRGDLHPTRMQLGVWGWWRFSKDEYYTREHGAWKDEDEEAARNVIVARGAKVPDVIGSFTDEVQAAAFRRNHNANPTLVKLNGLGVEIRL